MLQNGDCYRAFFSSSPFITEFLNSEVFTALFSSFTSLNSKTEFLTAKIFRFASHIAFALDLHVKETSSANSRFYNRNHPHNLAFILKKEFFSLKTEVLSPQLSWNYLRLAAKESPLSNERTSVITERISVVNRKNLCFFYIIIKYKRVKSNYISL